MRKSILTSTIVLFLSISIFSSTTHATVFYQHCNFQIEIQSSLLGREQLVIYLRLPRATQLEYRAAEAKQSPL